MQEAPIVVTDVDNHQELKQKILDGIQAMEVVCSAESENQKIYNMDWFLLPDYPRPYAKYAMEVATKIRETVVDTLELTIADAGHIQYWFQQYKKGDYHDWHNHGGSVVSNVYFVDLPTPSVATQFKLLGKEFTVEVREGQVLSFPSIFLHRSPVNTSDSMKTVVAFNF
jgi:hypothetical protein